MNRTVFRLRPVRLLGVFSGGLSVVLALSGGASRASSGEAAAGTQAAVASGGGWGKAEEVPGTAALNQGGQAKVSSVSCASPGNCSAGGYYIDGSGNWQGFVVARKNGIWGKAQKVPGTGALNVGGVAQVFSVSCASAGNCSAGGYYEDAAFHSQAFVVTETGGTWGKAEQVPGTALNKAGTAEITSVSCAAAGNCSAGGDYTDSTGHQQAFVVQETSGIWRKAEEVPGTAALNKAGGATVTSVSCASAGNCSAGGYTDNGSDNPLAFVVNETGGTWRTAQQVPGTPSFAEVTSVSCASAGNCSAGGFYGGIAFVVDEIKGVWGRALKVPGRLNGAAQVTSVSCASPGNCSAGGDTLTAFVVNETHGTWGKAEVVPGIAALSDGRGGFLNSVSCASAGNCRAGGSDIKGFTSDGNPFFQAFVVNETNGTWGSAEVVPGTPVLNKGLAAEVYSVSCASAVSCSAGGYYTRFFNGIEAFVVNRT
jgi:hypothetical protein